METDHIKGWDRSSEEEFKNRWARGDTTSDMAIAFDHSTRWIQKVRKRLGCPSRTDNVGQYRGGRRGVNHARRQ